MEGMMQPGLEEEDAYDFSDFTVQDLDELILAAGGEVTEQNPKDLGNQFGMDAPQVGPDMEATEKFHEALKREENGIRSGYDKKAGVWTPHKSLEGGTDTLGYGHKLTPRESKGNFVILGGEKLPLDKGLTEEEIDMLFQQDVDKARRSLEKSIKGFDSYPQKYQDVLTNIAFNVGKVTPKKWPKLIKAMEAGDDEGVRREMVTTYTKPNGKREKLQSRADAMAEALL